MSNLYNVETVFSKYYGHSCKIGDEFHFILECKSLENLRKNYLCKYYYQNPNIIKFNELMSTHKKKMLEKLCCFIVKIYDAVCTPNP